MSDRQQPQHFHTELTAPQTALQALAGLEVFSNSDLKRLAQNGAVWLSRFDSKRGTYRKPERLRRLKNELRQQDRLDLYYHPQLDRPCTHEPLLIADFKDYSLWLKPRGVMSQGSKYGDACTLYRWVEVQNTRPCWIVHRLDRATQGLMLLAHNKKLAQTLTSLFENRRIEKRYQANVHGLLAEAISIDTPIDDRQALSHIHPLYTFERNGSQCTRVEVKIDTGRKHQIRRHLSAIGHPVIGDRLHGDKVLDQCHFADINLQLTAYRLRFECPISDEMQEFKLDEKQLDLLHPQIQQAT
ncbi:RluA family pseudouridine synthase [Thiomicrorhabdus heinhorstiae]|uniref:RluA family pseudouridine synthase n=1 Tax=Thiomicrorhabdus heinhorstiae TaxID=2748010 RepID=A0ABS0BZB7_9GAMM|nr:RluA family pseudouridine synthase [Thiomicrorhabdus heinhorstiae]MBF6058403.1 RluA family pseudouridine synthase [Thiomicrorhabdus heinhorstiae]